MKRVECEHCGKTHQTFTAMDACAAKHTKLQCTCPPYWRRRWESHSFVYGCPLA